MMSVVAESDGLIGVSVFTTLLSMYCCGHCKPSTVHVTICSLNDLVHLAVAARVSPPWNIADLQTFVALVADYVTAPMLRKDQKRQFGVWGKGLRKTDFILHLWSFSHRRIRNFMLQCDETTNKCFSKKHIPPHGPCWRPRFGHPWGYPSK